MAAMEPTRPRGMSRAGFLVSSAMVATMSKPKGVRLEGAAWTDPPTTMKPMTAMLTREVTQLKQEARRVPEAAKAEQATRTATAMGSRRLKPSARAGTRMRRESGWRSMRTPRGGDLDGELGVAEDREEGSEARGGVGEDDGGAGVVPGLEAREDEHAGPDDGAEAEPGEIPPGEALTETVLAAFGEEAELGSRRGATQQARAQAGPRLRYGGSVGRPGSEGWPGEKVLFAPPPVSTATALAGGRGPPIETPSSSLAGLVAHVVHVAHVETPLIRY
ncbi:unnamed protein product [Spirodela intermedia]|uniref:Uncharacterized protein n=1 Tax=Spirodela intermedia TaxID=51605 RepID=A0A7I8IUS1_SPIIN|nr:unnamed protein product [Spirodela intermedia]CAA6661371.1 unnamed protein product [Spirodela intermedia]